MAVFCTAVGAAYNLAATRVVPDVLSANNLRASPLSMYSQGGNWLVSSIRSQALLEREDEINMTKAIRFAERSEDRQRSFQGIVHGNLRLVAHIAKSYVGNGVPIEDLIQEGTIGLMIAARKFEPEHGYKFSTYATYWIRQRILRSIDNDSRLIRIPVYLNRRIKDIRKFHASAYNERGEAPAEADISATLQISPRMVKQALVADAVSSYHRSLEGPVRPLGPALATIVADERSPSAMEAIYAGEEATALHTMLKTALDDESRKIMRMKYGLGGENARTSRQISEAVGVPPRSIERVIAKSMRKLRLAASNPKTAEQLGYTYPCARPVVPVRSKR